MSVTPGYDFFVVADTSNQFKMWQGLVGAHYTPSVDSLGNLSWTNNGELPNPPTVNIAGRGLKIVGIVSEESELPATANEYDCYLVGDDEEYNAYIYSNGSWTNIGVVGKGDQGFSPVVTVTPITGGHEVSIEDAEGTQTFNVMDGEQGEPGEGVASGGTTGQVLKKKSNTNYDTEWGSVEALPTGGTTGQVLAKKTNTNFDVEWITQSSGTVQSVNSVTPDQNGNILLDADDIGTDSNGISVQDAIDDYVHVGTSAPTDPTTKIWLDTDEPGMSAVSSVNGKTGTVVLDADDVGAQAEWTTLWVNASSTSDFAAQTIEVSGLANCSYARLWYKGYKSANAPTLVLDLSAGTELEFYSYNAIRFNRRTVTWNGNDVVFGGGGYYTTYGGTTATANNGYVVPYSIEGR